MNIVWIILEFILTAWISGILFFYLSRSSNKIFFSYIVTGVVGSSLGSIIGIYLFNINTPFVFTGIGALLSCFLWYTFNHE